MRSTLRHATFAVCTGMIMLALTALPARAIDINNLPDWVRDSIHPVEIDWSQVYPGLAAPPAWAQDPAAVQEVHPGACTPQATGIGALNTVSPAGPAGALNVAHPTTAATGGLQTASPAAGQSGIGGLAPAHPSAAATAGLHEVNPTPAAMTGLHEVKPGSSATAGLQPVSAGPIVGQINRLAPTDTQAQQLYLSWQDPLLKLDNVRERLRAEIVERGVAPETLVAVLSCIPLSHPMDPVYLPVCEVLWQRAADDLDKCRELPYAPRIYMATYLCTIDREADAKALILSLDNPDAMALAADYYHVANELAFHRRKAPLLAIWAWKRGSEMRGALDQALVCTHIAQTSSTLGDAAMLRTELIPWAEEALARPGSEGAWEYAFHILIGAYERVGETGKAAERREYWLEQARQRGISLEPLTGEKLKRARALAEEGQARPAADLLRQIIGEESGATADIAQTELVLLAREHPNAGEARVLPAVFKRVWPPKLAISLAARSRCTRTVRVLGNPTFCVTAMKCQLAWVEAVVDEETHSGRTAGYTIRLTVGPVDKVGVYRDDLIIETNTTGRMAIRVPLEVSIFEPSVARRDGARGSAPLSASSRSTGEPLDCGAITT